jgi:hypothetical protein
MKDNTLIVAAVATILVGAAAYLFWPQSQPEPAPVQVQAPPPISTPAPPPVKPEVHHVIEPPPAAQVRPLPALANSDKYIIDALAKLVGNKSLMELFHADRFIRNFVATIDNLPTRRAPMKVMPVEHAAGQFVTVGPEDDLAISPSNAARYTPYVRIATAVDSRRLVALYVRFYPLFQQAYKELGYPNKYFNDRLIVVLDDLLAAPVIKEPVKLVQPNVYFQYADPDLEARSIGQRILMRLGSKNELSVKAKLGEIRQELMRNQREVKMQRAK